jgi:hypothetical protein
MSGAAEPLVLTVPYAVLFVTSPNREEYLLVFDGSWSTFRTPDDAVKYMERRHIVWNMSPTVQEYIESPSRLKFNLQLIVYMHERCRHVSVQIVLERTVLVTVVR